MSSCILLYIDAEILRFCRPPSAHSMELLPTSLSSIVDLLNTNIFFVIDYLNFFLALGDIFSLTIFKLNNIKNSCIHKIIFIQNANTFRQKITFQGCVGSWWFGIFCTAFNFGFAFNFWRCFTTSGFLYHKFDTSSLFFCQIKSITTNSYANNGYQKHSLNNTLAVHHI